MQLKQRKERGKKGQLLVKGLLTGEVLCRQVGLGVCQQTMDWDWDWDWDWDCDCDCDWDWV